MLLENKFKFGDCAELIKETINPNKNPEAYYIGLEHIEQNSLKLGGYGYARDVNSQKMSFKKGDILFGKLRPYFRKLIIAPFDGICSTDIWVIRPKKGVDLNFLFYIMASDEFVDFAKKTSEGTRMPRAKWAYTSDFMLPYKSIKEQQEIGRTLRVLDDRISLLRETNTTLESIAQAIFKSWFVDFDPVRAKAEGREPEGMDAETAALFPDGFEESELGMMPRGWRVGKVEDLLELAYGKALKATDRVFGSVPVYGSGGITGYHNEFLIKGPSIIVGRKGTVGSLYWEDQSFFPIDTVFYVKTRISLAYCYYLLRTLALNEMNTDAAVPGLNRQNVYRLKILMSENKVVQCFDKIVVSLRQKIFSNLEQIETLTTLRDILLPRLISGRLFIDNDLEKADE